MPTKVQDFIFFIAIVAIAVGFLAAKFYQAVYNWVDTGVFDFYSAGITVMGGLIGGAAAFLGAYFGIGYFYFKGKEKNLHVKHFNTLLCVAPICIVVAHAFGRLGCLAAGCCHGAYLGKEYVFGGIYMKGTTNGWGYYVPTQLYEALFLFALFGVLTFLYFKKCNIILAIYLIAYAFWRMFIEFFRTDARGAMVLGLAPSQWQSVVFLIIGIALLVFYYFKKIPFFLPKMIEEESEEKKVERE
jgi:phosphatidylglycerol:prolipoprotein diacylglycerol transferase